MEPPEPATTAGQPRTLLVVDDTPENLSVLGEILMPHYRVRAASSGERALLVAASEPRPELILLDIMMPGLDGYQVLSRLRENDATRDIPVVFVTALDAEEDEAKGLALGAADYITKPLRPPIVLARVRTQLELKDARDRMRDQNAWLESEVARRMAENLHIQDVAMRALAQTLARKPQYADVLTPDIIELYSKSAALHDLGKVGIPDAILLKPGKLDPDEWEVMKTHAKLGADAIWRAIRSEPEGDGLEFLHVAMEIAHYHHEKWDGSGYPEGLSDTDIPFPARLMAVADVYDALICPRVYKAAMPEEEATRIIVEGRGAHFDPELADAFLACQEEFRSIAELYRDDYMAMTKLDGH